MSPIRGILFDAGGTLVRPHPSIGAVYAEVTRSLGGTADADDLQAVFREAWKAETSGRGSGSEAASSEAIEFAMWRRIGERVFARIGGSKGSFEDWFRITYDRWARGDAYAAYPDVIACLDACRVRGWKIAVCSNWDARLHRVLKELDLAGHFEAVVISSEAGVRKPSPGIFRLAAAQLGWPAAELMHVGDSWREDVEGAVSAGLSAVWLNRKGEAAPESRIAPEARAIRSLEELFPDR